MENTNRAQPSGHQLTVIVLAAGSGKRMGAGAVAKVLYPIAGRSMLHHVLAEIADLAPTRTVLVSAPTAQAALTEEGCAIIPDIIVAIQPEPRGTGDAVRVACAALPEPAIESNRDSRIYLVVYGDSPLLCGETLRRLVAPCQAGIADIVIAGFPLATGGSYGRIRFDDHDMPASVIEAKDDDPDQRATTYYANAGPMAFSESCLRLLGELQSDNAQREYYLTDLLGIARAAGRSSALVEVDAAESLGVNTRLEWSQAEALMQDRLRHRALLGGALLVHPGSVWLSWDTVIEPDAWVEPNIWFGPGVRVGAGARIHAFSHIEGATIGAGASIGPYARLRPGASIGAGTKIGNFVEIKNSRIGERVGISHLAYVGDATVGQGANLGAGMITCNYDGTKKHPTEIGAGAFIGSNVALIAPVRVGAGALVGAGSVITRDVGANVLALARGRQQPDKPRQVGGISSSSEVTDQEEA